jgi:hypothetical protein
MKHGGVPLYETKLASLDSYTKGAIEIVDDDPRHYAFSNVFEVANASQPFEKVVVGMNRQYTLEAIRTEGTSEWRTAPHDEFALVMDGEVTVRLVKLDDPRSLTNHDDEGSVRIDGDPAGAPMGMIRAKRGHMALLPADSAYQFHSDQPGVILLQTMKGPDSLERWADICITTV